MGIYDIMFVLLFKTDTSRFKFPTQKK